MACRLREEEPNLSIGAFEWSDGKTLVEVLDAADRAMYLDKASVKPELSILNSDTGVNFC
ncbi:MAG: hypothetical protein WBF04_00325 [Candidatus Sulfotelmatobacter sp.]